MRLEVYSHPLVQRYRTSLVTKAVIFQFLLFLLLVIAPVLIAYRTSGFWIKEKYYTEKPYVIYRHEAVLFVRTSNDRPLLWSTYPGLNQIVSMEGSAGSALVESTDVDNDYNGRNDYLELDAKFYLESGESVVAVNAYLFFDYQLKLFSRVETLGLALVQERNAGGASELSIRGDLNFVQKINLPHKGTNDDFSGALITDTSGFDMNALIESYNARNLTTEFDYSYAGWVQGASSDSSFVLNLHINYPEQTLRYEPGFLEELKFAWIQYLSIFVIFYFLFSRLKTFIFQNQVFPTVPLAVNPRKPL